MSERILSWVRSGSAQGVLRQLMREMGVPFLIALGWTIYSLVSTPEKRSIVEAISIFGPSFFLACWAFAQWFRVRKQQAVETGLGGIVKKQEALVAALAEATERLEGHATGGKSIGWLMLTQPSQGTIRNITAHVEGNYPLIDARANVLNRADADLGTKELRNTGRVQDFFKHHVTFRCGTLQPGLAILQSNELACDTTQPLIQFQISWTARNGQWTQFVELKRNDTGEYDFYTAVRRDGDWVHEVPDRSSIPMRPNGTPDVFWHSKIPS